VMTWVKREDGALESWRPSTWVGQREFRSLAIIFQTTNNAYLDCTSEAPVREQDEYYCSEWNDCGHGLEVSIEGYHGSIARWEHFGSVAEGVWYNERCMERYAGSVEKCGLQESVGVWSESKLRERLGARFCQTPC